MKLGLFFCVVGTGFATVDAQDPEPPTNLPLRTMPQVHDPESPTLTLRTEPPTNNSTMSHDPEPPTNLPLRTMPQVHDPESPTLMSRPQNFASVEGPERKKFRLVNSITKACLSYVDSVDTSTPPKFAIFEHPQDIPCANLTNSKSWVLLPTGENPPKYFLSYKHAPVNGQEVSIEIALETDPITEVQKVGTGEPFPFIVREGRFFIHRSRNHNFFLARIGKDVISLEEGGLSPWRGIYEGRDDNNELIIAEDYV